VRSFNIHEAKTHLSRLIEEAKQGRPFTIAKAGKPMVQVTRISSPKPRRRIGFLKGQIKVPDDIKTPFAVDIEVMFHGEK